MQPLLKNYNFSPSERMRKNTPANVWATVLLLAVTGLSGCGSMKPKPVQPSAFLEHAEQMRAEPRRSPYLRNWTNSSPTAEAAIRTKTAIWVAPVTLAYLRPTTKAASRIESDENARRRGAAMLAEFTHATFADAFKKSPQPRYQLALSPGKNTVTLELALVELNPNSVAMGVVRTALNLATLPGLDNLIGSPLKGNIAIEGKLRDSATKEVLFEFADNEESKSSLIFSLGDFSTYGQARQAINEWAAQLEELTRTAHSHKVKGSSSFVILPWQR